MSLMDMDVLTAAFRAHTAGADKVTRRTVIHLADMDGTTPRELVRRCERLGLMKPGSWDWFIANGGITREQIAEVRSARFTDDAVCLVAVSKSPVRQTTMMEGDKT